MTDAVEAYLANQPEEARNRLQTLRSMVHTQSERAVEAMNYGLIGYKLNGHPLIYFGGFTQHIGLYATPVGHEAFASEFANYQKGKGSVRLPLSEPLPVELIERVIAHRINTVGDLLPAIGGPATRALATVGVTRMSQLSDYSATQLLALHGVGPKAVRVLREAGAPLRDTGPSTRSGTP
jgi:uncharacterized protein YdhG (YjbR/CyaY superfamily)